MIIHSFLFTFPLIFPKSVPLLCLDEDINGSEQQHDEDDQQPYAPPHPFLPTLLSEFREIGEVAVILPRKDILKKHAKSPNDNEV